MERVEAEAILKQAAEAVGRRDGAAARKLLEPLVGPSPSPNALFTLAQAFRAEGDGHGERRAIDRLLALQPNHLGALLIKGAALSAAGDDDGALAPYQRALDEIGRASCRERV